MQGSNAFLKLKKYLKKAGILKKLLISHLNINLLRNKEPVKGNITIFLPETNL